MTSPEHARNMLISTIDQSLQHAVNHYRVYAETLAEQSVKDGSALGFIEIDGAGECIAEVRFPFDFLEKPAFTAGLELPDNVSLSWGSFPQWSATVATWNTRSAAADPAYSGALLGIVVQGVTKSVLHYQFVGRSYTNPTGASLSVGTVV